MKLYLDSSVLLAASGSSKGASRQVFRLALRHEWILLASPYALEEVLMNLPRLPSAATAEWAQLRPQLRVVDDVLTLNRVSVFEPSKDRPILFTALAWADVLLTLDRADFQSLLGHSFYGMGVLTPAGFLRLARTRAD